MDNVRFSTGGAARSRRLAVTFLWCYFGHWHSRRFKPISFHVLFTRWIWVFVGQTRALMTTSLATFESVKQVEPSGLIVAARRPSLGWVLVVSSWCGLVAGLLEVGAFLVRKWGFDPNELYGTSRDFVWLVPVTNLIVFVGLGVSGWLVSRLWPNAGWRLLSTGSCALLILPATLVAFPRLYGLAWLAVTLGISVHVVPLLERRAARVRQVVVLTWPLVVGIVLCLASSFWIDDRLKQSREDARPMPAAGSPNVLLVVLDTVGAGHLGLYGYGRPTSPTLVELAERGIRFDAARAGSSWSLPSHATMFTGRWLHELAAGWLTPLDGAQPTLAEFLGARGYATAGFAANYAYCARDSGLARGFTHYEDFWFPGLTCFKTAVLVSRSVAGIQSIEEFLESELEISQFRPVLKYVKQVLDSNRKWAPEVNRELLDWLSNRDQPKRPFFAFLNYYDAHSPYHLAPGRPYRFGAVPDDSRQRDLITNWDSLNKPNLTPPEIEFAATSYDECVADLDEQLGVLCDELERRGVLERTWLYIVADHGESFGEHSGVFCHGSSLYQSEVHVPFVIVPPGGTAKRVVADAVSLRDLAATIVDVSGMADGSPFPGSSLARLWMQAPPASVPPESKGQALTEVARVNPNMDDLVGVPHTKWLMGGLADSEWSYIRREIQEREELYDLRVDQKEQRNRADDPAARAMLDRMRAKLMELTAGPLTLDRFKP
jgi:arylsulfatase A-like enzyme